MTEQDLKGVTAEVVTSAGTMKFEFFTDKAPRHVKNFVDLAEKGFYEGTVFHRTMKGFMSHRPIKLYQLQGVCAEVCCCGGTLYKVKAEFNDTRHVKGVLSMARSQDPDSAGSQFFVCHGTADFLDRQYTAFGRLVSGEETLDAIASAPVAAGAGGERSKPVKPVKVERVVVHRAGKV